MAFRRLGNKVRFPKSAVRRARQGIASKVRQQVKRAMKAYSETKYVANAYADNTNQLGINWSAPINLSTATNQYKPALPFLSQGAGDSNRIGAKIMPTKVFTDLTLGYTARDLSCNEVIAVIYYGTTKAGRTWQAATPIQSVNDLLDNGDGTTSAFNGLKSDILKPINRHMNNAKVKFIKLGKTEGTLNAAAGLTQGALATSNGVSFRKVRLNFTAPKALQYDRDNYGWPSNYAPWFAVSFCRVDETQTGVTLADTINVSSLNHMYFKDV